MTEAQPKKRIELIDTLRGVAVFLMVFHHFFYDLCWLLGDRNPNRKLQRAGIDNARYRSLDTNGGVQRMRLVSPRECETLLGSLRATARLLALCNWLKGIFDELAAVKCDFCGGC